MGLERIIEDGTIQDTIGRMTGEMTPGIDPTTTNNDGMREYR